MTAGATITVKLDGLAPEPSGVVTVITPLEAPVGTDVLICWSVSTVKVASVAAKATDVAPVKPVPLIVTGVPTGPLAGEMLEIEGAAANAA
ncbi:MAG TPA: hypothetical protein VEN82_06185 [Actinomycetota bacterium]|nr:hypothetical protein [Actinomycetota bacterium]